MPMASIIPTAKSFFAACETGKGWAVCKAYCTPDATFSAQAVDAEEDGRAVEADFTQLLDHHLVRLPRA